MDRMIHSSTVGFEDALTLTIRRAFGRNDETLLVQIAKQVQGLAEVAGAQQDSGLRGVCERLHKELCAGVAGTGRPVLEYKNCSAALLPTEGKNYGASGNMKIEGYASTFGGEPDSYGDIISSGAFTRTLQRHRAAGTNPKFFFSHDAKQIAGAWTDFREDSAGLIGKGAIADTTLGRDLNALVEMGALDALSIGFVIPKGGADFDRDGHRIIRQIDLHEVSLVALPANPNARLRTAPAPEVNRATDRVQESLRNLARVANVIDMQSRRPWVPSADIEAEAIKAARKLNESIRASARRK